MFNVTYVTDIMAKKVSFCISFQCGMRIAIAMENKIKHLKIY